MLWLARGARLLSARQNSPPLLQCGGGGFRGRNQGAYSARLIEFSPSFSANRGRLWLTRRRRLLSVLLPLFCSVRGEALTRKRAPSQHACGHQETTIKMGKQQSKWTFLALQYLGLGAKKLGRLLSARATALEKKAPSRRASPPLLQCEGGGFDS